MRMNHRPKSDLQSFDSHKNQVEPYYWEEGGNPNVDWWAKVRHSLHFGGLKAVEGAEAIGEVRWWAGLCRSDSAGDASMGCVLAGGAKGARTRLHTTP